MEKLINSLLYYLDPRIRQDNGMAIYEELKMEVIPFEANDVIVTSDTGETTYKDDSGIITLPFVPANP